MLGKKGINSSKVYCKCKKLSTNIPVNTVLIVAKCIVNLFISLTISVILPVLIVAKCIVNYI